MAMLELLVVLVVLVALVALPVLVAVGLLRVVFELVLLPLRLLGTAVHVAFAGLGLVVKVLVGGVALLVGLVILPLLPLLLVALAVWVLLRILEPPRAPMRSRA
jgi:hypothetical protein